MNLKKYENPVVINKDVNMYKISYIQTQHIIM